MYKRQTQTVLGSLVNDIERFKGFPTGQGLSVGASRRKTHGKVGLAPVSYTHLNYGTLNSIPVALSLTIHVNNTLPFEVNILSDEEIQSLQDLSLIHISC